jgi:hypothetical protein
MYDSCDIYDIYDMPDMDGRNNICDSYDIYDNYDSCNSYDINDRRSLNLSYNTFQYVIILKYIGKIWADNGGITDDKGIFGLYCYRCRT